MAWISLSGVQIRPCGMGSRTGGGNSGGAAGGGVLVMGGSACRSNQLRNTCSSVLWRC